MPIIPVAHMAMVLRAVLAFVIVFGGSVVGGVTVVGFPNDYILDLTRTHSPSLSQSQDAGFGPSLGSYSCPTCLFSDANDNLLDYYGRPIDVRKLLDDAPTPTLPLKISFAVPFTSRLKPTPTPTTTSNPQPTPEAVPPPETTTADPASSYLFRTAVPRPGASKFVILLFWCQIFFGYIGHIVNTTRVSTSHATRQQARDVACGFVCGIIGTISVMATVRLRLPRLDTWKSLLSRCQNLFRHLGHATSASILRATKQQVWGIAWGFVCGMTWTISVLARVKLLLPRLNFWKSPCQLAEQQRLHEMAAIQNKAILEKEKRKINRIANQAFKTLRKAQKDRLNDSYERDVFATANIEPSFGPSLRNAETELQNRLRIFTNLTEGQRQDLAGVFKPILYSFTYAIAFEESRSGERNTRYLAVIDGQNYLIESLRLLHEHREQAFAVNEDLIRSLCEYDKHGNLISYGREPRGTKYSPKDDKFILSPLDGPAALSMKVSISSAGFHSRPDALLDSDPHWQRFLDSIERKREEQEVRHAAANGVPMEDEVEMSNSIEDDNIQGSQDFSQGDDEENLPGHEVDRRNGIKDASEQNHHDDEIFPSVTALHGPPGAHSQQSNDTRFLEEDDIKEATEQDRGGDVGTGESFLSGSRGNKPVFSQYYPKHKSQTYASTRVSWLKWQIKYLKEGYGTPEDPDAKPYSDVVRPSTSEKLTGDAAVARAFYEEEVAEWRKERILLFEQELSEKESTTPNPGESANSDANLNSEASATPEASTDPEASAHAEASANIEDSANKKVSRGVVVRATEDSPIDTGDAGDQATEIEEAGKPDGEE